MLNGRLFADIDGNITCISNDGTSIVDYIIASSSLFDKFSSFAVDNYAVSDHFPLICTLKLIRRKNVRHDTISTQLGDWQKFKLRESLKDDFLNKFRFIYSEFRNLMVNNEYNLSHHLPDFMNVFQSAGDLMRVKLQQPRYFINKVCQPLQCDPACSQAKSTKLGALRKFRPTNSCEDFTSYKIQLILFKAMCKLKKKKI